MLDANHPHIADLMFSRSSLEQMLLDVKDSLRCSLTTVKQSAGRSSSKRLFHVHCPALADKVRQELHGLETLHRKLSDLGVDFRLNQGLWLPAVADEDMGDFQVNLMISPSWVTKRAALAQVIEFAAENQRDLVLRQLDDLAPDYSELRLCRQAGKAYRVAIRNHTAGRRVLGLHDFAIVLGDNIIVNHADPRPRAKREDAWRGVEPPLFVFSGARKQKWLAYPPPQRRQPENQLASSDTAT